MAKSIDKVLCFLPINRKLEYRTNIFISALVDGLKITGLVISGAGFFLEGKDSQAILLGAGLYAVSVATDYITQKIADNRSIYRNH